MNKSLKITNQIASFIAYFIWKCRFDTFISMTRKFCNMVNSEILRLRLGSPYNISIANNNRFIGLKYVKLKGSFLALSDLRIECLDHFKGEKFSPLLEIGNGVSFGQRCHIGCIGNICIGNNVLFGSNILITDHSHGSTNNTPTPPAERPLYSKGNVNIGDNSWICDNVCILPNVTIGRNCIVGAGTIVNKNIPDNAIAVGNPLRILLK